MTLQQGFTGGLPTVTLSNEPSKSAHTPNLSASLGHFPPEGLGVGVGVGVGFGFGFGFGWGGRHSFFGHRGGAGYPEKSFSCLGLGLVNVGNGISENGISGREVGIGMSPDLGMVFIKRMNWVVGNGLRKENWSKVS